MHRVIACIWRYFQMALLDFGKVIFNETADIISWLQSKKLLASRRDCPACQTAMQWQVRADITDGYRWVIIWKQLHKINQIIQIIMFTNAMFRWRCPVSTCRKTLSVREGSFFHQISADSAAVAYPHSLVDERVSIWPGCRGSQGECWDSRANLPVAPGSLYNQTVSHSNSTGWSRHSSADRRIFVSS